MSITRRNFLGATGVILSAAGRYRLRADDGPPVGYAVVDDRAMVRYRTLDPHPAANSREIMAVLAGL